MCSEGGIYMLCLFPELCRHVSLERRCTGFALDIQGSVHLYSAQPETSSYNPAQRENPEHSPLGTRGFKYPAIQGTITGVSHLSLFIRL
jgi:hypothetical protein